MSVWIGQKEMCRCKILGYTACSCSPLVSWIGSGNIFQEINVLGEELRSGDDHLRLEELRETDEGL